MKKIIRILFAALCFAVCFYCTAEVQSPSEAGNVSPTESSQNMKSESAFSAASEAEMTENTATPAEPSTPSEPETPPASSTPLEPQAPGSHGGGSKPGGGSRGEGGRGGGSGTVSPGKAITSTHARGSRNLSAHWGVEIAGAKGISSLSFDESGAGIRFEPETEGSTFSVEIKDNGIPVLNADASGAFIINGLALRLMYETGINRIKIAFENTSVMIDTYAPAAGDEYMYLKSCGVGARRIDYVFSVDKDGFCLFSALVDGKQAELSGTQVVSIREETEE